jgi:hypothetical protein
MARAMAAYEHVPAAFLHKADGTPPLDMSRNAATTALVVSDTATLAAPVLASPTWNIGRSLASGAARLVVPAAEFGAATAAAILSGLTIALWSGGTSTKEEHEYVLKQQELRLRERRKGLIPPPPTPGVPGLVPPDPKAKADTGGFTPSPATPPLPGFTPAPPQSPVLPGRADKPETPFQLDSRNEGLGEDLRTYSERARKAAEVADKSVTDKLQPNEWRAHHLISMAGIREYTDLLKEAARAGWRTDEPANMAALPASPEAQQKLKDAGIDRQVHDSGHPDWNGIVSGKLNDIMRDLRKRDLTPGTDSYAKAVREDLEELQINLRRILQRNGKVTQNILVYSSKTA